MFTLAKVASLKA